MNNILKCILLFAFIAVTNTVNAQSEYTIEQFQSFSRVYTLMDDNSDMFKPNHQKIFEELGITEERYRELLDMRNSQNVYKLTPEEQILFDALTNEHQRVVDLRASSVQQLCETNNMPTVQYYSMLMKYKTDATFKQNVAPFLAKEKSKN